MGYLRMKENPDKDRGSGRTTAQLRTLYDMLVDGQYPMAVYVLAHVHEFRYAVPLFCHMICPDAKYSVQACRISFRNRFGAMCHIQLVAMDNEHHKLRGIRAPIAHDHHVIEKRNLSFVPHHQQEVMTSLELQGINPFAAIHIPK